jgi:hypothetical protein
MQLFLSLGDGTSPKSCELRGKPVKKLQVHYFDWGQVANWNLAHQGGDVIEKFHISVAAYLKGIFDDIAEDCQNRSQSIK